MLSWHGGVQLAGHGGPKAKVTRPDKFQSMVGIIVHA